MERLDTYEDFVYFVADMIVTAKGLSEEHYRAWKEECIKEATISGCLEFTRMLLDVIDKYSGRKCHSIVTGKG